MTRREFLARAAAIIPWLSWPASSQEQGRMYRVGVLANAPRTAPHWLAFFDELRSRGFVEPANLTVIDGYNMSPERANALASKMIEAQPDAILTGGAALTRMMQLATQTIPILSVSDDLIAEKAVISLARPGGNTSGISILATELDGKRQELFFELIPAAREILLLIDPAVTTPQQLQGLTDQARKRGVTAKAQLVTDENSVASAI